MAALLENQPKVQEAFRTGGGVALGRPGQCLFCATARFFRPGYQNNLVQHWLPALDGVVAKLERGAEVADVGCGYGWSTVMMARRSRTSQFVGYDYHEGSVEAARAHAREHGVEATPASRSATPRTSRRRLRPGDLLRLPARHGRPGGRGGARARTLKPDGTWMIVEPMAGDRLEDNLNPVGRIYYAGSTMICVPTSLSQEVGAALGAQAGEARLREVIAPAAASQFRRAAETPFNMVLEARPELRSGGSGSIGGVASQPGLGSLARPLTSLPATRLKLAKVNSGSSNGRIRGRRGGRGGLFRLHRGGRGARRVRRVRRAFEEAGDGADGQALPPAVVEAAMPGAPHQHGRHGRAFAPIYPVQRRGRDQRVVAAHQQQGRHADARQGGARPLHLGEHLVRRVAETRGGDGGLEL